VVVDLWCSCCMVQMENKEIKKQMENEMEEALKFRAGMFLRARDSDFNGVLVTALLLMSCLTETRNAGCRPISYAQACRA
jgi:hypothetical protein